ncbi:MAG: DUF4097 family beta strand repeat-containing protein [Spirochaetales bacterium]
MSRYLIAGVVLFLFSTPALLSDAVSEVRDAGRVNAVDIRVFDGSLTIEGRDTEELRAEGEVTGDDGYIDVEAARGGYRITARRRERPGTPSSQLTVVLPARTNVHIESGNANVDMSGLEGRVTVNGRRGDVGLAYEGSGNVDIFTTSGAVDIEANTLHSVRARSVDGAIAVSGSGASQVKLRSTGGDIDLSVERFRRGNIDLRNTSGTTRLTLGERSAAWIEMPRRGAQVRPEPPQAEGAGFGAVEERTRLAYRVGGGFGDIYISGTGGAIELAVE